MPPLLRRASLAVFGSFAVIVTTPVLVDLTLWGIHAANYRGVCGPYPTDIPEHPCSRALYMEGFWEPFATVGLLVFDVLVVWGAAIAVMIFWLGYAWLATASLRRSAKA